MNMVRGLWSAFSGAPSGGSERGPTLDGRFLLKREQMMSVKGEVTETIYMDAALSIRSDPANPSHYQLVVTKAFEDGNYTEEEAESETERAFPLTPSMRLQLVHESQNLELPVWCIQWHQPDPLLSPSHRHRHHHNHHLDRRHPSTSSASGISLTNSTGSLPPARSSISDAVPSADVGESYLFALSLSDGDNGFSKTTNKTSSSFPGSTLEREEKTKELAGEFVDWLWRCMWEEGDAESARVEGFGREGRKWEEVGEVEVRRWREEREDSVWGESSDEEEQDEGNDEYYEEGESEEEDSPSPFPKANQKQNAPLFNPPSDEEQENDDDDDDGTNSEDSFEQTAKELLKGTEKLSISDTTAKAEPNGALAPGRGKARAAASGKTGSKATKNTSSSGRGGAGRGKGKGKALPRDEPSDDDEESSDEDGAGGGGGGPNTDTFDDIPSFKKVIAQSDCELRIYNTATLTFEKWEKFLELGGFEDEARKTEGLAVKLVESGKKIGEAARGVYFVVTEKKRGRRILMLPLTPEHGFYFEAQQRFVSFIWIGKIPLPNGGATDHLSFSLALIMPDQASYRHIHIPMIKFLWEAEHGSKQAKALSEADWEYVRESFNVDVPMQDADDTEEEEEEETESSDSEVEEEIDRSQADDRQGIEGNERNTLLEIGYKARTFVNRRDHIAVFANDTDSGPMKYETKIPALKHEGALLNPDKIMLHEQDAKMVVRDKNKSGSLYLLDLFTGQVQDKLQLNEDMIVKNFHPEAKHAQQDHRQTFLGISSNSVFTVDPRVGGKNQMVEEKSKTYSGNPKFHSMATTDEGAIALAGEMGDIKLYDRLGIRAKTVLPSHGGIRGVDVTADGRYIVATCKDYLLFIDTEIKDGKNKGETGFMKSFPASNKPTPRRLAIKPENVLVMGGNVDFTPAKFNTGAGGILESSIITSSGQWSVTWKLRQIKQGKTDPILRQHADKIVAEDFKFGNDREVIVTMPKTVWVDNNVNVRNKGRKSGANDIVRHWDG